MGARIDVAAAATVELTAVPADGVPIARGMSASPPALGAGTSQVAGAATVGSSAIHDSRASEMQNQLSWPRLLSFRSPSEGSLESSDALFSMRRTILC